MAAHADTQMPVEAKPSHSASCTKNGKTKRSSPAPIWTGRPCFLPYMNITKPTPLKSRETPKYAGSNILTGACRRRPQTTAQQVE